MPECRLSNGLCLRYREKGNGPVVLMLHGWTGGSWFFDSLIEHLSPEHRCIAPDLKGHGHSDKPLDSSYTMAALVSETREFVDKLGLTNIAVIGHSMGGMIAQQLCLDHGSELGIRALVLLSTGPGSPVASKQLRRIVKGMRRNIERHGTHAPKALARRVAITGYDPEFVKQAPEKIEFALDQAEKVPPDQRVDLFEDMSTNFCLLDRLSEITAPCLCICGTKDNLMPATELLAERIPNAKLVSLERAGHMICWEREAEVNQAVADFLNLEIHT